MSFTAIRKKLQNINAEPGKISWGYALGIFLAATPFIGLKVFIALGISSLFRISKVASVFGVYHINPITAPAFYAIAFYIGRAVLGVNATFNYPQHPELKDMAGILLGDNGILLSLATGGVILGLPMAAAAYYLSYAMVRKRNPA